MDPKKREDDEKKPQRGVDDKTPGRGYHEEDAPDNDEAS